jgi:hypothetical protein
MTLHPKNPTDLMLAPVAAAVDLNLVSLRDRTAQEIELELALALDLPGANTCLGRVGQVVAAAVRDVDPHGWEAMITDDHNRLRLQGGSVSIELGLGTALTAYIQAGS